jgi:hypothetical protein
MNVRSYGARIEKSTSGYKHSVPGGTKNERLAPQYTGMSHVIRSRRLVSGMANAPEGIGRLNSDLCVMHGQTTHLFRPLV